MSFDLIKKQKARIEQEKRKIVEGADFSRHPLAYQPVAKGKSEALKEQIVKTRGKLDSVALTKKKHGNQNQKPELSQDKNAAALFYSNMQAFNSGKKGKHIADVFYPNDSLPFGKRRAKPKIKLLEVPRESYLGYNESEAHLKIKLNQNEKQFNEGSDLAQKLGDLEVELPSYDSAEIYENFAKAKNQIENQVEDNDFWEEIHKEQQKRIELKENPESNEESEKRYNTSVKLSFRKPEENVVLEVSEEDPEAWNMKHETENVVSKPEGYLHQEQVYEENKHSSPTQPRENIIDLTKNQTGNGYAGKSGVKISVSNQPENRETNVLNDYAPQENYYFENYPEKSESEFSKNVKNISSNFKNKINKLFTPKEDTKILDFEFKNGREYAGDHKNYEEREKTFAEIPSREEEKINFQQEVLFAENFRESPFRETEEVTKTGLMRKMADKLLTRREELALRKSIHLAERPAKKFKQNFFTFRSSSSKRSAAILSIAVTIALTVPLGAYVQKVIEAKNRIEETSGRALDEVKNAKTAMAEAKPEEARHNFETAYQEFISANESLDQVGGVMLTLVKVIPGGEKVESGRKLLEAGKHLTMAGQIISEAFGLFLGEDSSLRKKLTTTDNLSSLKEVTTFSPESRTDEAKSLTEAIVLFKTKLDKAKEELSQANDILKNISDKDIPEEKRSQLVDLKNQLPIVLGSMDNFEKYTNFLLGLLGHNEPKTYLFLFENNDEIRATGGFIGTYGIIKINEGTISQLFIDGIYNPDGQLKERIIPPKPIQKMSATWSMHDANWWPDFPKSAEKVAWFYEKTGGPTVDGVIALTPKLMRNLLDITGPIKMDSYGVTVDSSNFIELTQYKVEVDYDKKMNRPKQFLADLAPIILSKIFNSPAEKWVDVLKGFSDCLKERQILMYFLNSDEQKIVSELGWSGEIIDTPKDYLSVVNTNISGLKTDRMIEQKINHSVEIKPDGSVFDTVSISRSHKGGNEKYEWYNGVNSDWMRVYVPKGSQLLSAEGYTREVDSSPVDYEKLGFIKDEMVSSEEEGTTIDPYSGTQIYEDSGKTVFANWTYVSPGETLTVKYTYLLPFKLRFDDIKKPADTYSLLLQKQAGDERTKISSEVKGLENFSVIYNYPKELPLPSWKIEKDFNEDVFAGVVLTERK